MRARILIVAALMVGVWAAARFKRTSENGRNIDRDAAGAREILPMDAPGSDVPVVSDIEARNPAELALVRPVKRRATPVAGEATARSADAGATHDLTTVAAAALVPEMSTTTTSMAEAPLQLAQAPLPVAPTPGEGRRSGGDGADHQPADGSRGPAIIIRGGIGSPNDPCARHGPRILGPGIAINRALPPVGGGILVNDRAPRGRGGTARIGMSRGGIR